MFCVKSCEHLLAVCTCHTWTHQAGGSVPWRQIKTKIWQSPSIHHHHSMYIHMYIYIWTQTHTHTDIYIYISIYLSIYIYLSISIPISISISIPISISGGTSPSFWGFQQLSPQDFPARLGRRSASQWHLRAATARLLPWPAPAPSSNQAKIICDFGYRLVSWDPIVRNFPKIMWYPGKGGWASIVMFFLRSIFSGKHEALYPPFFDESW